jgi:YD repeat-containing protein
MSPFTIVPPPVDAAKPEGPSPLFWIGLALVTLSTLAGGYQWWLLRSDFAQLMDQTVVLNPRVREEFGAGVEARALIGWRLHDTALLFGPVWGKENWGYVSATMRRSAGHWSFPELRVHDVSEGHVIPLSAIPPVAKAEQLHAQARLYLVALGSSAEDEVDGLAAFLHAAFAIPLERLPTFQPPAEAYDGKRHQWVAEMLAQAMARRFPDIAQDQESRIIGIIDGDLYLEGPRWRYAYNYREAGKYAVIPTARLDPGFYGYKPSSAIKRERLEKVTAKNVGLLYFGFPMTSNPESVMLFAETPRDMDGMSGQYLLSDLASQPSSRAIEGTPCLTISTATLGGRARLQPIHACHAFYDLSEGTIYEVDLSRGEFRLDRNDLFRPGPMPLFIRRLYASHAYDGKQFAFGKSTWQNLDDTVWSTDAQRIQTVEVNGVEFSRSSATPGEGFSPDATYIAPENAGEFSHAVLSWENGRWKIQTSDQEVRHYLGCGPNTPVPCYFMDQTNLAGDSIQVVRNGDGRIERVVQKTSPALPAAAAKDHTWRFTYEGRTIQSIEDNDGSSARYTYDDDGYLRQVVADGHTSAYQYDGGHRMNRVLDDGRELEVRYDAEGRAVEIDLPNQTAYRIHYSGEIIEVRGPGETYLIKMRAAFFELDPGLPPKN